MKAIIVVYSNSLFSRAIRDMTIDEVEEELRAAALGSKITVTFNEDTIVIVIGSPTCTKKIYLYRDNKLAVESFIEDTINDIKDEM